MSEIEMTTEDTTVPSPLAREMAELIRQIVRDELREADRERREMKRQLQQAADDAIKVVRTRDRMKGEAGYPTHESFDNVWRHVLERAKKYDEANKHDPTT